jgi:hypothetical protein
MAGDFGAKADLFSKIQRIAVFDDPSTIAYLWKRRKLLRKARQPND